MNPCRVVVGIDFSAGSGDAVAEARRLTAQISGALELVHVAAERSSTTHLERGAEEWLAHHGIAPDSVMVRVGMPWIELARYANETQPVMIVVGSHGGSGFHPLGLGSTTARLGVVSPVPVLVVAPRARVAETMVAGASRSASVDQPENESTGGTK